MKQHEINSAYNDIREQLVTSNAHRFNSVGVDPDEVVSKAFEYVAQYIINKGGNFEKKDLKGLICAKINLMYKDARAGASRIHGRKSVKALAIIDAEPLEGEDYRVSIVDKYSYGCYMLTDRDGDDVDRSVLQSLAIKKTMKKNGASDRDVDIVDRFLWSAPDRKALAAEFKTSVTNVNRIKCVWMQRLPALAPQIKTCYAELLKQAA